MFKLATTAISLLALVASSQALAAPAPALDQFTFTSAAAGESFSWVLPNTLTPDSFSLGTSFTINVKNLGQLVFYDNAGDISNGGGLTLTNSSGTVINYFGPQAYIAPESNPTFLAKGVTSATYLGGTNYVSLGTCDATAGCAATLSVTALPQITPVPEPETYGMMLAGLGLMGFMINRKKSV